MVYVKVMKKKTKTETKTYTYWAENYRENGKVKVKLLRRLTPAENLLFNKHGKVDPIDPIEGRDTPIDDYPPSQAKELETLKSQILHLTTELKIAKSKLSVLDQWMKDVESGKLPNSPNRRPKAWIRDFLRPLLEEN